MRGFSKFSLALIVTLCSFIGNDGYSQNKLDSLLSVESEWETEDTTKVNLILDIVTHLGRARPEFRKEKLDQAVVLSEKLNYPEGLAQAYKHFQRHYLYRNNMDSSIYFADKALLLARDLADTALIRNVMANLSTAFRVTGKLEKAKDNFQQILELDLTEGNVRRIATTYTNLGGVHAQLKQLDKSMEYFLTAEPYINEANHPDLFARYYLEFGHLYRDLENAEKTLEYYRKSKVVAEENDLSRRAFAANINLTGYLAFDLGKDLDEAFESATAALQQARKLRDSRGTARVYMTLGSIESRRENYAEALTYYDKAIPMFERMNDTHNLIGALKFQVDVYRIRKEYTKAITVSERIVDLAKKRKDLQGVVYQTRVIALIYLDLGNFKKAYEYEREGALLADSLSDVRNAVQVGRLESAVELAEKEKENAILTANNELELEKSQRATLQRNILIIIALIVAVGAVIIFTLQRARQRAITKLVSYEKNLNKMRTDVFMSIAHEIRTPLTLIYGPARELQRNPESEKGRLKTIMKTVTNNCEKIIARIEEIFDLSKLENQDLALHNSDLRLKPFVEAIFNSHEIVASLKKVSISLNYTLEEDIVVTFDQVKVTKIVENLLSNAVKFTPTGGEIRMDVFENGDQGILCFRIVDSGLGIKPEDLSKIFERYYRSEEAVKIGGSGIGLALARELARLMDGDIKVESELGEGSVFTFSIPFMLPTSTVDVEELVRKPDDSSESSLEYRMDSVSDARVLVVEDDLGMQEYLNSLLSPQYTVSVVGDGVEALETLNDSDEEFDLIISDIMMPRMDGFELLDKLKTDAGLCGIPIIMLTAKTGLEDRLKALRIGVDDYINKPFDSRELLYRVSNLISNKKARGNTIEEESDEMESELPAYDIQWLSRVEGIVKREIDNTEFSVGDLADEMASSTRQVQRKLNSLTGLTPVQYIRQVKLDEARALLESGQYQTVSEVSYRVGFDTPYYFSTLFFKQYGKRPTEYLRFINSA